ncbi:hypothetical protein QWY85_08600 [Neolewinella lacunae]|uniref:Uncharacterized protein n=1 Tax=Neolewinella lacunae TaxID=1517758 RepID=A0A923T873_9BACT|nr:hypothetical protein [Neolewinella lacunae]MBC6993658.1 hypothetical protein [Neolewinella lacunae]MDN3634714.1 hypothetical protein [Neolewinella lacunae]
MLNRRNFMTGAGLVVAGLSATGPLAAASFTVLQLSQGERDLLASFQSLLSAYPHGNEALLRTIGAPKAVLNSAPGTLTFVNQSAQRIELKAVDGRLRARLLQ